MSREFVYDLGVAAHAVDPRAEWRLRPRRLGRVRHRLRRRRGRLGELGLVAARAGPRLAPRREPLVQVGLEHLGRQAAHAEARGARAKHAVAADRGALADAVAQRRRLEVVRAGPRALRPPVRARLEARAWPGSEGADVAEPRGATAADASTPVAARAVVERGEPRFMRRGRRAACTGARRSS